MKNLLLYIVLLSSIVASAQPEVQFLEAFGNEDLSTVTSLLSEKITVCINDDVKEVNRAEAINSLSAFIESQTINRKKILHNGKSSDKDSSYKVARIKTDSGTYRVFAYSEKEGNTNVIKEIRIDKM